MVDQVCSLRKRAVHAIVIMAGSGGVEREVLATEEELAECSLLYSAPEALTRSKWRELLEKPVFTSRIVVVTNKAHRVSMW